MEQGWAIYPWTGQRPPYLPGASADVTGPGSAQPHHRGALCAERTLRRFASFQYCGTGWRDVRAGGGWNLGDLGKS